MMDFYVYTMYTIPMKTTVQLWGNSLAIRIPKSFAMSIGIGSGREVDLSLEKDSLRIQPTEHALETMLAKINAKNLHRETEVTEISGREIW